MKDKKKGLAQATISMGASPVIGTKLPKSSPSIGTKPSIANPVSGVKVDRVEEARTDNLIADEYDKLASKLGKIGIDTRSMLQGSKKVRKSAQKGIEQMTAEEDAYHSTSQDGDDSYEPGKGYFKSKKKK